MIIWVLTLCLYVVSFYEKESGSWGLLGSSESIRLVIFFCFLQKEEQILLILDHEEASPSLSRSSTQVNTYVLDVFSIDNTKIYTYFF